VNFSRRLSRRTTIKKYRKEKDAGVSIRWLTDDGMRHGGDSSYGRDADRKIGGPESAGINRQEAENEKFSRERSSDPLGPEFCAGRREAHSEA
jgi:hypothetical protein